MSYFTKIFSFLFLSSITLSSIAQLEICMVTADYNDANSYMIIWEQPADISNLDSVFIFKKTTLNPVYEKIGSVEVSAAAPTFFSDLNANLTVQAKYAISTLDINGLESFKSLWHQPAILDFEQGTGILTWKRYNIEFEMTLDHILQHDLNIDESGLNLWNPLSSALMNSDTTFTDQAFSSHLNARYDLQVTLDNCTFQTKANINRSRSNIKQQFSNASASINENGISNSEFTILENPVNNTLSISFDQSQINGEIKIISITGKVLFQKVSIDANAVIDVSSFDAGAYYISFVSNKGATTKQFMKL